MSELDFYQQHLNRVSRSFAFCIARLKAPLRAWVGLTYLICRILDTVEDAPWGKTQAQISQFGSFDKFLSSEPEIAQIEKWSQQFPKEIPEGERRLLKDSHVIFQHFHDSPSTVKGIIGEMVENMSAGMQYFVSKKEDGRLRLKNLNEVNQYCFFVAGVVGEALAKLVAHVEPQFKTVKARVLEAHHFGLFLQKVNLLKDQLGDEKEGRSFVCDRGQVKQSLAVNALGAFQFLNAIPLRQKEFRIFCGWSLFLGLASLPWAEENYKLGRRGKIPRSEAQRLLAQVERSINDSDQLKSLFTRHMELAGLLSFELLKGSSEEASVHIPADFENLYSGLLSPSDLKELGITA